MKWILLSVFLLLPSAGRADTITTSAALEMTWSEIDGPLVWTSDVHLRTAAFHEDEAGYEPTGASATARTLITESFKDGVYTYVFDPLRVTDRCGRIQLDLESIAWGLLAGGVGAYAVIDFILNCAGTLPAFQVVCASCVGVVPEVPEPGTVGLVGVGLLLLARRRRSRT